VSNFLFLLFIYCSLVFYLWL